MIYGRIYKIYCNETAECYYGSTIQTLSRRLSKHKGDYNQWKKGNTHYKTSYKIIERGNFTISLLEEGEFQNKDFMEARERHYIENNDCVNKNIPTRTDKEYRETHREQMKKYREANREVIQQQMKEYYEANREQILEQNKQKYNCECGGRYTHHHKSRHLKSAKHINYLAIKN